MNNQLVRIALALALVVAILTGCQPLQPVTVDAASAESVENEFLEAVMAAEAALQSEDPVDAASYYTDNAVSMPPGFPPSYGKEAIQGDLEFYFDSFDIERDFELVNYQITGDTATRMAEWTQTLTPTDGSDPFVETGRCVLGWEKGRWRVEDRLGDLEHL